MDRLLNQLIIISGAWSESEDPAIEWQFAVLFEELKQSTGLDTDAAVELINNHGCGSLAA